MLRVQVFGPGGTRSKYRSRIFWIDGRRTRAAAKGATAEKAVPFPSDRPSIFLHYLARGREQSDSTPVLQELRADNERRLLLNLTQMASASVKIIFDTVPGHPMREFEIMRSQAKDDTGRTEHPID